MDWKIDIYKDYKEKIYGFILFHVKSEEIAQDLTHDVFVKLYNSYTKSQIENTESVIWTITRNRIVDHHRKVANSRKYRDYLWNQIQSNDLVNSEIEFQETKELFKAALKELTPQQWKIYTLIREEGLSYNDISKKLNISPNTVKNHMVSALKSIRNYLRSQQEIIICIFLWFLMC
ncbi:RNA polymerase sigma factor [Membranihabitans maritimus]|uniref:RNA polymerase sigma factor n=1 Tax=Membranihabitans maritimus TaxID=2904244 RepID=UPI001F30F461|nr:sigma-70 family RNA polymerase sigma factor [Membranihabitans maritimus]